MTRPHLVSTRTVARRSHGSDGARMRRLAAGDSVGRTVCSPAVTEPALNRALPWIGPPAVMKNEVRRIVASNAITAYFQPIVDLSNGTILGYEGLSRGPSDSFLHSPVALFEAAEASGLLFDVERCAMQTIVGTFRQLALPGRLFLNVTPSTIAQSPSFHREIEQALEATGLPTARSWPKASRPSPT